MVKISNLDLGKVKPVCPFGNFKAIQDGPFLGGLCREEGMGGKKDPPFPKPVTHPTMKKLGIVIPYLKKIQKIHKSRDTPLEFC